MKIQEAKKVYDSLVVLANFLGMTESNIAAQVSLFSDEKFEKIKKAVDMVNNFNEKGIKERAEMMGYSYKENKDGSYEISTELSFNEVTPS